MTSFGPPQPGARPHGDISSRPSRAQYRRRRAVVGATLVVLLGIVVAVAVVRGGNSGGTATGTSPRSGSVSSIPPSSPSSFPGSDAPSTSTVSPTIVATSAPADPTTSPPAPTELPTTDPATVADTTFPPGKNVLGLENGKVADPASAVPEERFVAHLGDDATAASPGTPATIYAEWWQLFLGRPLALASPNGFVVTDRTGQRLELSGFSSGPDGQVGDLQECVLPADPAPLCNQLGAVISLDPTAPVVGQSPVVQFTRLAEFRLLLTRTVRFVTYRSVQPIVAATSPTGEVRLNDHLLAFEVPKDAPPPDVALTVTYADGTSETVSVGL